MVCQFYIYHLRDKIRFRSLSLENSIGRAERLGFGLETPGARSFDSSLHREHRSVLPPLAAALFVQVVADLCASKTIHPSSFHLLAIRRRNPTITMTKRGRARLDAAEIRRCPPSSLAAFPPFFSTAPFPTPLFL